MAWNPSPEVAAVRDAAVKLKSKFAVVVYLTGDLKHIAMASYGSTRELCDKAGAFGEYLVKTAEQWGNELRPLLPRETPQQKAQKVVLAGYAHPYRASRLLATVEA